MDTHPFAPSRPDGVVCVAERMMPFGPILEVCGYPAGHPIPTGCAVKRRGLLRLGLLVPLPALLGAKGCKGDDGSSVDPNRGGSTRDPNAPPPPWSAQDDLNDKIKVVTISAWVEREFGPYYVKLEATDHDSGEHAKPNFHEADDPRGERVEGGHQFRFTLAYPTHHRVELEISAEASRPGSHQGYIATRDGKRLHRSTDFNGLVKAHLTIWTER